MCPQSAFSGRHHSSGAEAIRARRRGTMAVKCGRWAGSAAQHSLAIKGERDIACCGHKRSAAEWPKPCTKDCPISPAGPDHPPHERAEGVQSRKRWRVGAWQRQAGGHLQPAALDDGLGHLRGDVIKRWALVRMDAGLGNLQPGNRQPLPGLARVTVCVQHRLNEPPPCSCEPPAMPLAPGSSVPQRETRRPRASARSALPT